jgi:hypothetical protein
MELSKRWCDNTTCPDFGKVEAGNLKAFSYVERRYSLAGPILPTIAEGDRGGAPW